MPVQKLTIEGRPFWFTAEPVSREDPMTGELTPTDQYYCTFSTTAPGALIQGEILKNAQGRARLFPGVAEAWAAGEREVKVRLSMPPEAYAVGIPGGNTQQEFDIYVDLLRHSGVTSTDARVADSYGRHWLHVWEQREDAERFARRLRQRTKNRDWEVYDLSPPYSAPAGGGQQQGPLEILVGSQSDGKTYSLHPNSLKRLRSRFPEVHPRPSVFIGSNQYADIEASVESPYEQVAIILTGLSSRQLHELGGYRIVDPLSDLILYRSESVRGQGQTCA